MIYDVLDAVYHSSDICFRFACKVGRVRDEMCKLTAFHYFHLQSDVEHHLHFKVFDIDTFNKQISLHSYRMTATTTMPHLGLSFNEMAEKTRSFFWIFCVAANFQLDNLELGHSAAKCYETYGVQTVKKGRNAITKKFAIMKAPFFSH